MSVANLEKTINEGKTPVAPRPRVKSQPAPKPRTRPTITIRTEVQERTAARPRSPWGARIAACFTAFVVTYGASSLAGQVMVERARRMEITARERAREARKTEASLRARVDMLKSPGAIEEWATRHGFGTPSNVPVPKAPELAIPPRPTAEIEVTTSRAGLVAQR